MGRTRALAVASLLALAACAAELPVDPHLVAITPASASGLAPLPVEIEGRQLDAIVHLDLGDEGGSAMDAAFAARLSPCDGGAEIPLEQVLLASPTRLTAVVPAGGAAGRYDLAVVAPGGRELRLPDAFRLGPSVDDVVAFRFDPVGDQRAGAPFPVAITAVDALGRVVEVFDGGASVEDLTGTASPSVLGPFVLGTSRPWLTVAAPAAPNRLSASDGNGLTGTSNDFAVAPGPAAALAFAGPLAASVSTCARADVALHDAGGFATTAAQDLAVRLDSAPPGALLFYGDAACTAAVGGFTVPSGAAGAAFHVRGAASGSAAARLVPDGLPTLEEAVEVAP